MLVVETVVRIRREHAGGKPIKAIARNLRLSLSVVRKAIRASAAMSASASGCARSRAASDTVSPSYFAFQLKKVASLIPCLQHRSAVFTPAACSRSTPMICSSVNRLRRITRLHMTSKLTSGMTSGEHVTTRFDRCSAITRRDEPSIVAQKQRLTKKIGVDTSFLSGSNSRL